MPTTKSRNRRRACKGSSRTRKHSKIDVVYNPEKESWELKSKSDKDHSGSNSSNESDTSGVIVVFSDSENENECPEPETSKETTPELVYDSSDSDSPSEEEPDKSFSVRSPKEKKESLEAALKRLFRFQKIDFASMTAKELYRIKDFTSYIIMSEGPEDIPEVREVMQDYDLSNCKPLPDLQLEFANAWGEFRMHYEDNERMNSSYSELLGAIDPFDYNQEDHELLVMLMIGFFRHWHEESQFPTKYEDDPLRSWGDVDDLIIDAVDTIIY